MTFLRALLLSLCLALSFALPAAAQETHIRARLVAESERPAPGRTVMLAFEMSPAAGWHGYWKNPGDSGVETRAEWTLPEGLTVGDIAYPVPHRLVVSGLMNYVYEGPYALLVPLKVPAGMFPGTRLPIRVKLDWLACTTEVCVPESAVLPLTLVVGDGAPRAREAFDRFRAALPHPLESEGRFAVAGDRLRLAIPYPAAGDVEDVYFFPLVDGALDYAAPQTVGRSGDMLVIETKAGADAGALGSIGGVLRINEGDGLAVTLRKGTVPAAAVPITPDEPGDGGTLLLAFGGAVLGGLILNIMPCVFPILSLKALSLARSGGTEAQARREALAYTAGVVLVCAGLGAALLVLRAAGAGAGWAFQLQDPRVILILFLLVTVIGFNLAGLFELGSLAVGDRLTRSGGSAGAFWTGALAAFIATPCTGPFMGAALGAAVLLPGWAAIAVFVGLGLGLGLPFLMLGFIPALRRMLPRPGAWMDVLRRILSLPMFVTALGLAWVLGRQAGVNAMVTGLFAALLLAAALWWVGVRQASGKPAAWAPLLPALALALVITAALPRDAAGAAPASAGVLKAEPFSETRLAALRKEGRPVFAYFTADWCLSCKVNEKVALEREEVAKAFAAKKVAVLVGDWTRGDAAIGRFLAANGRSGVPLYLYYPPGKAGQALPQVLTPSMLTAL
ncbi:protein-disulfide reductase DsbD family protein [Sphingomonas sp. ID0503]|uniref:protein-disulfide reductase DsbD family protein n=1 Tax=Sphingomonas sp. ID0503 TaxID=3399691 RepID=UPI003AFAE737